MTGPAIRHRYEVSGMACGHCAAAVTEELESIAGVTAVAVDVDAGVVTVTVDRELGLDEVRAAVDDAGYELLTSGT